MGSVEIIIITTVIQNKRYLIMRNCRAVFLQLYGGAFAGQLLYPSGKKALAWHYDDCLNFVLPCVDITSLHSF